MGLYFDPACVLVLNLFHFGAPAIKICLGGAEIFMRVVAQCWLGTQYQFDFRQANQIGNTVGQIRSSSDHRG